MGGSDAELSSDARFERSRELSSGLRSVDPARRGPKRNLANAAPDRYDVAWRRVHDRSSVPGSCSLEVRVRRAIDAESATIDSKADPPSRPSTASSGLTCQS